MKGIRTTVTRIAACYTCGVYKTGSEEDHAQRAWAKLHAKNNPGHEACVTIERETIYCAKKEETNGTTDL